MVPVVPSCIPHSVLFPSSHESETKVINKTIVHSDTVLNLKELGENLVITSIDDINEYLFEDCLKTIFKSNTNVVFHTIQYSKLNKKIYFYTDKEISKKDWEERNKKTYKPLKNSADILKEIKQVLLDEQNMDIDCVSIYTISNLIHQYKQSYDDIKKSYGNKIDSQIKTEFPDAYFVIYNFDYDRNELKIGFNRLGEIFNYEDIIFSKQNGDLYIKESETIYDKEILNIVGNTLSELYDKLISFKEFKEDSRFGIQSINSNFNVSIGYYEVSIYKRSNIGIFEHDFRLRKSSSDNDYSCDVNSNNIISEIKGNEDEIFKRIFVKIAYCPEWMREELFALRKKEIAEEKRLEEEQQRIEEERKKQQRKKQKRIEFRNKIFPFLKNK